MAEHVLSMTLALLKCVPEMLEFQRRHLWHKVAPRGLAGMTVGIVGTGVVGRAVAVRIKCFGTYVVGIRRQLKPVAAFDEIWAPHRMDEMIAAADVLVLACPLTHETRRLIDHRRLRLMKPSALLVNVSRGGVVVDGDLVAAMREGRPGAAALDVFEDEPLPEGSPLWDLQNVIVSRHSSSTVGEVWRAVMWEFAGNLRRYLSGEQPQDKLRPNLGY